MFYMDIGNKGDLYVEDAEPNLELTDDLETIASGVLTTDGIAFMGLQRALLS